MKQKKKNAPVLKYRHAVPNPRISQFHNQELQLIETKPKKPKPLGKPSFRWRRSKIWVVDRFLKSLKEGD